MSRLSQNACDNRGTHYRIENKRAMTLIAEMVLIVIVSFTGFLYNDGSLYAVLALCNHDLDHAGVGSPTLKINLLFQ